MPSFASMRSLWSAAARKTASKSYKTDNELFLVDRVIPLLVFIDMLGVALVVPLLFAYYRETAHVTSSTTREYLQSIFAFSQIVGGVISATIIQTNSSKSNVSSSLQPRSLLLASFGGSLASYALLLMPGGNIYTIILSRVLVGVVKQTMTVCTSLITKYTAAASHHHHARHGRTRALGRMQAASTSAWVVGPTLGGILYQQFGLVAPGIVSCGLFALNIALALCYIPLEESPPLTEARSVWNGDHAHGKGRTLREVDSCNSSEHSSSSYSDADSVEIMREATAATAAEFDDLRNGETTATSSISHLPMKQPTKVWQNLSQCFMSPTLSSLVLTQLLYTWVTRATNYSQLGQFYEDMYGVATYQRGYITSYMTVWALLIQSVGVKHVLHFFGGAAKTDDKVHGASHGQDSTNDQTVHSIHQEITTVLYLVLIMSIVTYTEGIFRHVGYFLIVVAPIMSLCNSVVSLQLQSLVTHVVPVDTIFNVLAALDVLQNAASVTTPVYRTALFQYLNRSFMTKSQEPDVSSNRDPDPVLWVYTSALHWFVATIVMYGLLRRFLMVKKV
jgi:MFS family permease